MMPRPVYYQPTGNPLQLQKVPRTPLELEFAYRSRTLDDDKRFFWRVSSEVFVLGVAVTLISWLWSACLAFGPVALLLAIVLGAALVQYCRTRMEALSDDAIWVMLLASIVVTLPIPRILNVFVSLVATILFARELARNFTFVATVCPMPVETAWTIREAMSWQTAVASIAIVPVGVGLLVPAVFFKCIIVCAVSVIALAMMFIESDRIYRSSLANALVIWCCYNREDAPIPGTLPSPTGTLQMRLQWVAVVVLVNVCGLGQLFFSPVTAFPDGFWHRAAADGMSGLIFVLVMAIVVAGGIALVASTWVAIVIAVVGMPAFGKLSAPTSIIPANEWKYITDRIRQSNNRIEQNSIYMGRISHDQSPLLVPKKVFLEHAHILGDSGSGKTARGLTPFVEQIMATGEASVMLIDLKGDSHELFEAGRAGARAAREVSGVEVGERYLNDRCEEPTYAFNPLRLRVWEQLTVLQKTDVLCGALGLIYGTEYGEGYYSSANASVLYATMRHFPDVASFRELAERISYVIARPKAHGLDAKARDAGNHVLMVVTRLATNPALNVTELQTPDDHVFEMMMDPASLFERPELHYYNLSATLGPGSAPEIGRIAIFMLMISATLMKRHVNVYLIIDEFQRIATRNLDYLLQLARSMGVAVILANQSIQDLKRYDLVPVLETNCRYRQWFSVSGWEDQDRLSHHSGETVDVLHGQSFSTSTNSKGTTTSQSSSSQQFIAPRLTLNDIKLISDDDRKSIVLITRGEGYAQYGGMPVVVETDFHITAKEYDARRTAPWPVATGTFIPQQWDDFDLQGPSKRPTRPVISIDATGDDDEYEPKPRGSRKRSKRRNEEVGARRGDDPESNIFADYLRDHPIESCEDNDAASDSPMVSVDQEETDVC